MLTTTALISLACLLSTGEVDTAKLTAGLSQDEAVKVQSIIESGVCLPENFSKLIDSNGNMIIQGKQPTGDY